MVGRIQGNRSAAKARSQVSHELAGIDTTGNQRGDPGPNGVRTQASLPPPQTALSSDLSELLKLVRPDNAALVILAAIKVLGQEALSAADRKSTRLNSSH